MNLIDGAMRRHVSRFDGDVNAVTETDPRIDAREALRRQTGVFALVVPRRMAMAAPTATSEPDAAPTSPYGALLAGLGRH